MSVDRYDFVDPDTRCFNNCGHRLSSGAGYIVLEYGEERVYGESCVQQIAGEGAHRGVPDFTTRAGLRPESGQHGRGGGGVGRLVDGETDLDRLLGEAKRYLKLRMQLLGSLDGIHRGVAHPPMRDIYERYRCDHAISEGEASVVLAMEANAPRIFKWENLLDVHTARHQIDLKIKRNEGSDWLIGYLKNIVRPELLADLWLSREKLDKVKLKLRQDAFQGGLS